MICILDYGLGNVASFVNLYERSGIPANAASNRSELGDATHLILPGVGSFDTAMKMFSSSGMRDKVETLVLDQNVPILGVCVGMQMLADGSAEGDEPGLGFIPGLVDDFRGYSGQQNSMPLPHMGWNHVQPKSASGLFCDLPTPKFYFLHSFYFKCKNDEHVLGTTDYLLEFHSAIRRKNVFGVQFHPEKSHSFGNQLLSNFANL